MAVLYFCLDTSRQTIQRRLAALCRGSSIPLPANLYIDFSPLDLSQAKSLAVLRGLISEYKAGLVILDALARYLPGIDENTVASVGPVLTGLRSVVAETGATILILHHLNKGYGSAHKIPSGLRIRGSSDILAAVDTALITTSLPPARAGRPTQVPRSPDAGRRLIPVKNREQPESPPLFFDILPDENGGLRISFQDPSSPPPAPPPLTAFERVLALLQQQPGRPFTRQDITASLTEEGPPVSRRTFDRVLVEVRAHPSIQVNRDARSLTYTWEDPPSSPPA